jgi:hypothetical protein
MNARTIGFIVACVAITMFAAGINPFAPGDPYQRHILTSR